MIIKRFSVQFLEVESFSGILAATAPAGSRFESPFRQHLFPLVLYCQSGGCLLLVQCQLNFFYFFKSFCRNTCIDFLGATLHWKGPIAEERGNIPV